MSKIKRITMLVAIAATLSLPPLATAQDDVVVPGGPVEIQFKPLKADIGPQNFFVLASAEDEKAGEAGPTEYWLGLQVAVVPELAKRQLAIAHGLAVEEVAPDSPAAKAEIKKFDILLQAGDMPLKGVGDLIKSVEAAKGKQIIITLKRDGESRKVEAVAEPKTKVEATADLIRKKIETQNPQLAGEIKQLEEAIEKLKEKAGKDGFGMWFSKPAIVAPRVDLKFGDQFSKSIKGDFPKDLSVQINKQGVEPTKIHVKRGDQEWNVTEDKLSELPEDVRVHVQTLLGRMQPNWVGNANRSLRVSPEGKIEGELKIAPLPPLPPRPAVAPVPPVPPMPPAAPAKAATARAMTARIERDSDGTDAKLDAIMKKLDKLEKEIDQIRDKK